MTAKHTPGPWQASETTINGTHLWWHVAAQGATIVSEVRSGATFGTVPDVAAANARLIAAAPDLLEVLQALLRDDAVMLGYHKTAVRAAITKATS
jgi:hypothetical protein